MPELTIVEDKDGVKYQIKVLDPADQLDILEAAGENSGNQAWLNMAYLFCSVVAINEVPVVIPMTRNAIRALAKKIGNNGLTALSNHFYGAEKPAQDTEDAVVEIAKN